MADIRGFEYPKEWNILRHIAKICLKEQGFNVPKIAVIDSLLIHSIDIKLNGEVKQ